MEFGAFSNGERRNEVAAVSYQQDIEEIVLLDELGFREAWVSEHLPVPKLPRPDRVSSGDLFMSRVGALTKQIRLGPAVRSIAFHHPLQVAMEAAVNDHLMQGRYQFAFGSSGPTHDQLVQRGMVEPPEDFSQRVHRVHEALDYILKCWTGPTPFDYQGQFWHGKGIMCLPKPFQKPHMPVAVASGGRTGGSVELAGRMGFILLQSQYETAAHMRDSLERYLKAAVEAGRKPTRKNIRAVRFVYVADTDETARNDLREGVNASIAYHRTRDQYDKILPPGFDKSKVDFDTFVDIGHFCVGDPDTVYDRIKTFYDESGGFGVLLLLLGKDYTTPKKFEQSMRLFAKEVAPRLAVLDPDLEPAAV